MYKNGDTPNQHVTITVHHASGTYIYVYSYNHHFLVSPTYHKKLHQMCTPMDGWLTLSSDCVIRVHYFIWQLTVGTYCQVVYCINRAHTAHHSYARWITGRSENEMFCERFCSACVTTHSFQQVQDYLRFQVSLSAGLISFGCCSFEGLKEFCCSLFVTLPLCMFLHECKLIPNYDPISDQSV